MMWPEDRETPENPCITHQQKNVYNTHMLLDETRQYKQSECPTMALQALLDVTATEFPASVYEKIHREH